MLGLCFRKFYNRFDVDFFPDFMTAAPVEEDFEPCSLSDIEIDEADFPAI